VRLQRAKASRTVIAQKAQDDPRADDLKRDGPRADGPTAGVQTVGVQTVGDQMDGPIATSGSRTGVVDDAIAAEADDASIKHHRRS
jgi:hypothetical protein